MKNFFLYITYLATVLWLSYSKGDMPSPPPTPLLSSTIPINAVPGEALTKWNAVTIDDNTNFHEKEKDEALK